MFPFLGSSASGSVTPAAYLPNNAAINYSDYCAVSVNASRALFTRPIVDGQGLEYVNPGARIRFVTNAAYFTINLQYTNLVLIAAYNGKGVVFANGTQVATFTRAAGAAGPSSTLVLIGSSATRTIDIVLPYGASVEFVGVSLPSGATFSAPAARPATRYVAAGDSITHGFFASGIDVQWSYLLAAAKGWQQINSAYGGRKCVPSDGTVNGNLTPTVASYLIGINDYITSVSLTTFASNYTAFINNFRAIRPTVKLYCITPIYSTVAPPASDTLEMFRQKIRDVLTTLGNPLNVLVEGLTLMTNNADRLTDGIHPNDLGSSEIFTALNAIVTV